MTAANPADLSLWRLPATAWMLLAGVTAATMMVFYDGLRYMVQLWAAKEEYSYGYAIPLIALYLVWQRRAALERLPFEGSWAGPAVVAVGLVLFVLGELSTLYVIVHYAFLTVLAGLALALMGWRPFRVVGVAFLLLLFMIPLPDFLYQDLSARLQLISSELGVWLIRLVGISVYLEGNVIDMGSYKLQVVEACNGLRYLFPLATLAFIAAYWFHGPLWKRVAIFVSSAPISILLNGARIGAVGATVEYWGPGMADGFLHDFEGWSVFMASVALLVAEMWLLARIGPDRQSLASAFRIGAAAPAQDGAASRPRTLSAPFVAAVVLLVAATVLSMALPKRAETVPERERFSVFPMNLGDWRGRPERLEQIYVDKLKFDDYLLADFVGTDGSPVNLYGAYYGSQRKGESVHSPRSCLPGGGWQIVSLTRRAVDGVAVGGQALTVNRALIQKGDERQLVYYWFQQRGRVIGNEYMVKWYLFWDALTRNRTDGAMLRLTTAVDARQAEAADRRLASFAAAVMPSLRTHVPE